VYSLGEVTSHYDLGHANSIPKDSNVGSNDMIRPLFAIAIIFWFCNSSCAEGIAIIAQNQINPGDGTTNYLATIIDHNLNVSNMCTVTYRWRPPKSLQFRCQKVKYKNLLPDGANISTVSQPHPPGPGLGGNLVIWEVDQNTGAVQFCVIDAANPEEPCILLKLVL
jgi:hypothetical protein